MAYDPTMLTYVIERAFAEQLDLNSEAVKLIEEMVEVDRISADMYA
jgi:hypothetical protein